MKNKAVFLDRDGVINNESGHYYIYKEEDFELNKGIAEALSKIALKGYLLILISNQGGIARGIFGHQDVEKVHTKMKKLLEAYGVRFTEIYYCPHHPEKGKCICRKPGTLMIEKAVARFHIDVSRSYFVGDREKDMLAGSKAGLNLIKVIANADMEELSRIIP